MGLVGWLALGLLGCGLWLTIVGLRGRRVNDHFHCRGCGFDLVGLAAATRCPECGRVLGRGMVCTGKRQRRVPFVAGGGAMALLGCAVLLGARYAAVTGANVQSFLPTDWLLPRAESADWRTARGALQELSIRLMSDELDAEQIDGLVESGLVFQADPSNVWVAEWGTFMEAARAKGFVDDADFMAYARTAIEAEPRVHNNTTPRRMIAFAVTVENVRGARDSGLIIRPLVESARIDGEPIAIEDSGTISFSLSGVSVRTPVGYAIERPPGAYQVEVVVRIEVREVPSGEPLLSWTETASGQVEIPPPE